MASHDDHEKALSFLDHLEELRIRLFKVIGALLVGFLIGYAFADYPLDLLLRPLMRAQDYMERQNARPDTELAFLIDEEGNLRLRGELIEGKQSQVKSVAIYRDGATTPVQTWTLARPAPLIYLRPMDPFVIRVKAAFVLGLILVMPVILYQAWAFIEPGLLPREKKLALPMILAGTILFPLGAAFAYFLMDVTLRFFTQFVLTDTVFQNDARAYLSFALTLMLAFGAVFELPLGIVLATRVGLLKVSWLAARRAYIFITLLVLAALITPTGDPITLMAMALPLQILFEIALIVSRILDRWAGKVEDTDDDPDSEVTDT